MQKTTRISKKLEWGSLNTSRSITIEIESTQRWAMSVQLRSKVCSYAVSTFCGVH